VPPSAHHPPLSRRHFLRQILGAGAAAASSGFDPLFAQIAPPAVPPQSFRFAFLTDFHLMQNGALRSADGMAACLTAVEKLTPRPEFILVGGDLVHRARDLTISDAQGRLDFFLKIWNDHTALPAYWTFGNHDLVGTSNPAVSPNDKDYGKGLFQDRFHLPHLFYSFDYKGWHFVILDDIDPLPDRTYIGKLFDDNLQFLQADLDAHRSVPTLICAHIPILTNLPLPLYLAASQGQPHAQNLVCTNGGNLIADLPRHNVKAVLAGHLHHLEKIEQEGVPYINCGAVCANYWQGSTSYATPEGFGVIDLAANGSLAFNYHTYGWKAA
jgi:DNA repair exonuclease SbcCD nuclease subunit